MKKQALLWSILMVLSGTAVAVDQQEAEARKQECTQWALDDGLSGEELEVYIQECMAQE
jgi:hypothetical protein